MFINLNANSMKLIYCSFLFLLFGFICGCNDSKFNLESTFPNGPLMKIKNYKLGLDELSSYEFFNVRAVGEDTLIVLNSVNYSLDFYHLEKGEMIHRIKIKNSGPEGLPRLYSFIYHNSDSIFLLPQFSLKGGMIINEKGEFVDRLNVGEINLDLGTFVNHNSSGQSPSYIFGNKLYFTVNPLSTEFFPDGYTVEYELDLTDGNLKSLDFIQKPVMYLGNKMFLSQTLSRKKIGFNDWLYSWNMSDTLYLYSKKFEKVEVDKIYLGKDNPIEKTEVNGLTEEELLILNAKSHVYGNTVLQDSIIHRVRYVPMANPEDILFGSSNPYLVKDFEILSFDLRSRTFLGSTSFKGGVYDPRVIFSTNKGIYLPKINPGYKELNENFIEYDLFSIPD